MVISTVRDRDTVAFSRSLSACDLPTSRLFGTDGIRGKVGELLTPPLAWAAGFWTGQVWHSAKDSQRPVLIGQDSRNSSPTLAAAIAAGLNAAGLDVWHLGLCPTPCVAYLAKELCAAGGVMISASHNPPEDNGIKFFGSDGIKLSSDVQAQIEAGIRGEVEASALASQPGTSSDRLDLVEDYALALQQSHLPVANFDRLHVVLDLAWGAATRLAAEVFQAMGARVTCLHDRPDGDRINVHCGSTHLGALQQAILDCNADLGFAFDGDADRVLAVDHRGRTIDGDYLLYLWGNYLRAAGMLPEDTIVATVMSNLGFERAWQGQGGILVRTKVGDQYVSQEMIRRGAMLGGEQSGHILCRHYGVSGDGLLTALHVAACTRHAGSSLADLVDGSFQTFPQLLRNVRVEDRDRRCNWQQCDPVQTAIAKAEAALGDRGRILVRASGTEPVIRVMVEAETSELAEQWTTYLVESVQLHLA